jgi:hypothetical protein
MYITTGQIKARTSLQDIAKRLETGFAPILKRAPGFMGFYVIQTDDKTGAGTAAFQSEQDWNNVSKEAIAWYDKNITPLCAAEPVVITGTVVVSIEADAPPMSTGAATGAEARHH